MAYRIRVRYPKSRSKDHIYSNLVKKLLKCLSYILTYNKLPSFLILNVLLNVLSCYRLNNNVHSGD